MNKQSRPPVNLTQYTDDKNGIPQTAVYLPAISTFYSNYVAKQRYSEFIPKSRMPAGFDRGIEGMNFLNDKEGYFTYKYGLYSAGHAQWDLVKTIKDDAMIQDRDRSSTLIVADSSGYQIGKGVIKFDWNDFEGKSANKTRTDILHWMELTADWAMMLDVPMWACDPANRERTGLTSTQDCLDKTRINNEFFLNNRLGHTKLLNVLQGNDWESAEHWYQGVKEYSEPAVWGDKAAEGWAMGGVNMCKMDIALKRLITLREDNLLQDKNWIHFLGTAQLDWACYLTSIQRQIRKHINEKITLSFDCASPFIATAHGLVYTNAVHTPKKWSVVMDKAPDNKALAGSTVPFPFESEFGRRLTIGDICYYANGTPDWAAVNADKIDHVKLFKDPELVNNPKYWKVMGDKNKINKVGSTSWDSFGYALMMGHNVYCHIAAVQRANQLMDIECAKGRPNWRHWNKLNAKDVTSDQHSAWVPRNILYFDRFVEELFALKTKDEAFALIKEAKSFLQNLEGARLQGGPAKNKFNTLFEISEVTDSDEISLNDPNDEALRNLEDGVEE